MQRQVDVDPEETNPMQRHLSFQPVKKSLQPIKQLLDMSINHPHHKYVTYLTSSRVWLACVYVAEAKRQVEK